MNPGEYQRLAMRTECDQTKSLDAILNGGVPLVRLMHSAVGLTSDAGEVAAAIERCVYYGHTLDRTNLVEELGDCLWYIAQACNALDVDLGAVMQGNIAKLKKRYPHKFEEDQAEEINRDRAAERSVLEAFTCKACGTDERVACDLSVRELEAVRSAKDHFCPSCSNPLSDEVVKRLILGQRDQAGCPQCAQSFCWNFDTKGLSRAQN